MDNVQKIKKRAFQYWFSDGLNEIGLGFVFVVLGIYFLLEDLLSQTGLFRLIVDSSLILVILGSLWLVNRGIRYFKENVTYLRTGFVTYDRTRHLPRWVTGLIAGITGALIACLLVQSNLLNWLPALTGGILSLVFLYLAFRVNLVRFHVLAILSLVFGFSFSWIDIDPTLGTSAVYLMTGFSTFVSGLSVLFRYLRNSPRPEKLIDE